MQRALFLSVLMIASGSLSQPCFGGERDVLAIKIGSLGFHQEWGFLDLCFEARVPCGFEKKPPEIAQPPVRQDVRTQLKGKTVKEILDFLVAGPMKGYAWRVSDGVLEMLPEDVMVRRRSSVLNKRIPSVDIENVEVLAAAEQICETAGIAKAIAARPLQTASFPVYGKVSVHLKDVTAREVLNALVRADGKSA